MKFVPCRVLVEIRARDWKVGGRSKGSEYFLEAGGRRPETSLGARDKAGGLTQEPAVVAHLGGDRARRAAAPMTTFFS